MLGLDTGSYAFKFCLSEKRGPTFEILRVGEVIVFDEGTVVHSLSGGDIRSFFQRHRLPREAALSFSYPHMVLQRVSLPEMSQEELENALQWEAHSLIPGEESFQVSWNILGKSEGKMDILFSAVPSPAVEAYVDTFARAGVRVEAVEPHVVSLIKGFLSLHSEFFDVAFTLVDLGFEKTTVICFSNHTIALSRYFSWGMRRVWDVLRGKFQLPQLEAFEVLRRGESTEGVPYQLEDAVLEASQDLVLELKRSFTFLQAEFGPQVLERVFLSGGGALCQPLREYITQGLSLSFQAPRPLLLGKNSLSSERFLAAVGVSLWK